MSYVTELIERLGKALRPTKAAPAPPGSACLDARAPPDAARAALGGGRLRGWSDRGRIGRSSPKEGCDDRLLVGRPTGALRGLGLWSRLAAALLVAGAIILMSAPIALPLDEPRAA